MKNIHVRVRFFCTTHGLFKVFVIFHLCIFLWSAIIVALSIVCPGPEISAYHNFTATMPLFTWQNKFYCHICYGSTPACDSIPIPIHPTFSTAVILPSEMAFLIYGGLWQPYLIRFLWPRPSKSCHTWQLQRLYLAHQLYTILGIFYLWRFVTAL